MLGKGANKLLMQQKPKPGQAANGPGLKTLNLLHLRYKKNKILEELVRSERDKEHGIILQCFRWLVNEGIVAAPAAKVAENAKK